MNATAMMCRIDQIDLDAIKNKLMHEQSGEGWTLARANAMEAEYRRFLYMLHTYPQEHFAPLVDVDTFWHYHILDTRKYAADCEATFGYFVHHHPYVGLGDSADDAAEHAAFGARMHELYLTTFGEPCIVGVAGQPAANAPTAWCSIVGAAEDTAWCSVTARTGQTAWCSLSAKGKQTAWCSLTSQRKQTAWCSLTAQHKQTAWCSVTAQDRQTAWCSVTAQDRQTAWCSVTAQDRQTAWCSVTAQGKQTAWCSVTAQNDREAISA